MISSIQGAEYANYCRCFCSNDNSNDDITKHSKHDTCSYSNSIIAPRQVLNLQANGIGEAGAASLAEASPQKRQTHMLYIYIYIYIYLVGRESDPDFVSFSQITSSIVESYKKNETFVKSFFKLGKNPLSDWNSKEILWEMNSKEPSAVPE